MPPSPNQSNLGWKAFFGLLAFMQVIGLGVMWRTYDAVSDTARTVAIHEYVLNNTVLPAIRNTK